MLLGRTVYRIQNIYNCIHAAYNRVILVDQRRQFPFEHAFHLFDYIRRRTIHRCNPLRYIRLYFRRKRSHNHRGLRRRQIGQNHSNRLRMLILYKVQHLARIGLAHKFKRPNLQGCGEFGNYFLRPFSAQSLV